MKQSMQGLGFTQFEQTPYEVEESGTTRQFEKEVHMIRTQWSSLSVTTLFMALLLCIPAVASAAGPAEQKPCADELEKFCKDVRPGEGRILKCLQDHDSELSPICRDKVKEVMKRVEEAKQACAKDIEKFCAGVTPGGGRLMKCLKPHLNELTPECREKFKTVKARAEEGRKTVQ
jgi:hypothetical protein